ncbi:MAG: Hint domain-containing protein [Boseongicola sp.]
MPDFTLQFVYSLGDFDTSGSLDAVPDEQGARAQGSPPWQLQLNAGVSPQQLTINDDDSVFDEIGGSDQILTSPITIDGVTYPIGDTVIINYVITTDSGFEGFSITIGSNNTGNNTTTAFVTNQPMVPGQTYEFTSEGNIGNNGRPYSEFVCFTLGTKIRTPNGELRIEDLSIGSLVETLDDGPQSVKWIGQRTVPAVGKFAPVIIREGTLGATADLVVSPNHRILVLGRAPQVILGLDGALVAAKTLVNGASIQRRSTGFVTYFHLMFDRHQIVWANNCLSESLFLGERALSGLDHDQRVELFELFPELKKSKSRQRAMPARPLATTYEGRALAAFL